jgi:hypothetical protein
MLFPIKIQNHINTLLNKIPDLMFVLLAGAFLLINGEATLLFHGHVEADRYLIFVYAAALLFRKESAGINILTLVISHSVHSYCAQSVGTFPELFQFSWLAMASYLVVKPESYQVAIVYQMGLTFDAAFMRTTGLGMQASFYCANLTLLLVAGSLEQILKKGITWKYDIRHLLVFAAGLFFLNIFREQPVYTSDLTMLFAGLALFWTTISKNDKNLYIVALGLSGSIIALISIGNLAIISENFGEIFRRRAWAAGTHPNRIATWAFAMQLLLSLCDDIERFPGKKSARIFQVFLWAVIILTGARIVLALSIISQLFYYGRELLKKRQALIAGGIILILAFARIMQKFSWAELIKNERLLIWYSAWQNIIRAPIAGHGFWTMSLLPQSFPAGAQYWAYDWNYPHAHQMFLELLTWGGLTLLLTAAAIFFAALLKNKTSAYRFCLAGFLATGLLDFAWGSPSMLALAFFLLFFDFAPEERKCFRIDLKARLLLLLLGLVASFYCLNHHYNIRSFEIGTQRFASGKDGWAEQTAIASENLREPFPKMHLLIRKAAAGYNLNELIGRASALTLKYPDYYAVWFLAGRLLELNRNREAALTCYQKAVELEPRDLTGIRHARLMLTLLNGSDNVKLASLEERFLEIVKNGGWGLPLLINHRDFGQQARGLAANSINRLLQQKKMPDIELLFLFKNATEWGIPIDYQLAQKIDRQGLPPWLADEFEAALLKRRFSTHRNLEKNDLEPFLKDNAGPALCKAVAGLAVDANFPDIVMKAYQLHRQAFNFRGKNYEDLQMQFYAAQGFLKSGNLVAARNELDRIAAFDHGNPAVFMLLAEVQRRLGNFVEENRLLQMARQFTLNCSFQPNFHFGVYDDNWPEGDHWTLVIEKTLRRRDNESRSYCENQWMDQIRRIDKRLAELREKK